MAEAFPADPTAESERLDTAVDQAIAACGGDLRGTIRALILANVFWKQNWKPKFRTATCAA